MSRAYTSVIVHNNANPTPVTVDVIAVGRGPVLLGSVPAFQLSQFQVRMSVVFVKKECS